MKGIYLAVFLTIHTHGFVTGHQCFNFTWPGMSYDEENNTFNCTEHVDNPFIPCMTKLYYGSEQPNKTELSNLNETYIEQKAKDNVCIKYTYMYRGIAVNISYFQGKVIENGFWPITSHCYIQYTEGFSIEVCVCDKDTEEEGISMPCNSTIRNSHSALITFAVAVISLFMYKI